MQERKNIVSLRQKGSYCIICLGESTTQNQYPPYLEEILNKRNIGIKFSVIDKGLGSANTLYILAQLEDNLNRYKPDMVITMMGINDYGPHMPYESASTSKVIILFKSFRTYKLIRLLWLHVVTRFHESKLYTPNTGKRCDIKLGPDLLENELKERYAKEANSPSSEELLKESIALNPKNYGPYIKLGELYYQQCKFSQAEESYKKAIELSPQDDRAYTGLGNIFYAIGNSKFTQAEEALKKAIEISPLNYEAYATLGLVYRDHSKFTQAEEILKKAIELDPFSSWAYMLLGTFFHIDQGKFTQAEEALKKAIELNPLNDSAYGALAAVYADMGKNDFSHEYFKKANKLREEYYNPMIARNYLKFKKILDKRKIKLVCVQYPVRSVEPLKKIFEEQQKTISFVDNEKVFKEALRKTSYKEYFVDIFGGDFGHCTEKGNRLLAENIANVILKEVFGR
ncbi:MAG: tetratricopeptide repeat protein [Candidatus Omnitrophota bacterium]